MDIEMLKDTGLTQAELAELFGVTRPTINFWLHGRFKPHALHREKIEMVTAQLAKAVADGRLPLPEGIPKHQRVLAVQSAFAVA